MFLFTVFLLVAMFSGITSIWGPTGHPLEALAGAGIIVLPTLIIAAIIAFAKFCCKMGTLGSVWTSVLFSIIFVVSFFCIFASGDAIGVTSTTVSSSGPTPANYRNWLLIPVAFTASSILCAVIVVIIQRIQRMEAHPPKPEP